MGTPEYDAQSDWESSIDVAPVNYNKRLPAILLLDTSSSMSGAPINELNSALKLLQTEFDPETGDPTATRSVELALVTFGAGGVQIVDLKSGRGSASVQDAFVEAGEFQAPVLAPGGSTPMGEGMRTALTALDERKRYYRQHSIAYFRPWIFLISDGAPTDSWQSAAGDAVAAERGNHLLVFPIGVAGADLATLGNFSTRPALMLQGLKFRELFQFISNSLTTVSNSDPGTEAVAVTPEALSAWAQIPLSHG